MNTFLSEIKKLTGIEKTAVSVETSLPDLLDMLDLGYMTVKWITNPAACHKCQMLDGSEWDLREFIETIEYEAPIFCRSHPQCVCSVICSGPGLISRVVTWEGVQ